MFSPEGEYVEFLDPINTYIEGTEGDPQNREVRSVEDWLNDVQSEMERTLKANLIECRKDG
jgi:hypothetical protein